MLYHYMTEKEKLDMIAWFIVLTETDKEILLGYSVEDNDSCDGRISFDKRTWQMTLIKQCSNEKPHGMYGPIRGRLMRKEYQYNKKNVVAIG